MASAGDDGSSDEGGPPGAGDREWVFRGGELSVRVYEDFVDAAIGGVVTTASVELARYVAEAPGDAGDAGFWRGLSCVELGSGCGLVSSTLKRLGARAIATDLEPFLEHLRWNLGLNDPLPGTEGEGTVEALDWGCEASRQGLRQRLGAAEGAGAIVAANCVYDVAAVAPFLATVADLSSSGTVVLMCGVPQPPKGAAEEETILDALLAAAPRSFDCYLFAPGGRPQTSPPPSPRAAAAGGPSARIAAQHGVSVNTLADGIWAFLSPGSAPPSWARPMLKIECCGGSGSCGEG